MNNLFLTKKSKSYNKTLNEPSLKNMFSCKVRIYPKNLWIKKTIFLIKKQVKIDYYYNVGHRMRKRFFPKT